MLGKYRAGFSECMNEVTRFLSTCEGVNSEVRTRLLGHLANCMTQLNAMNYPAQAHVTAGPVPSSFGQSVVQIPGATHVPVPVSVPGAVSCKNAPLSASAVSPSEAAKVYGGFQLVPATDGQFAFLIPSGAFTPGGQVIPVYAGGAGTALPSTAASPRDASLTSDSVWRPW